MLPAAAKKLTCQKAGYKNAQNSLETQPASQIVKYARFAKTTIYSDLNK